MRTQQAEVLAIRDLAADVREMVLRPLESPIPFEPGQWISVHLPLGGEKPVVRAYTMAEPASSDGTLVLCFDKVKGGAASTFLFGVEPGARLTISGTALGNFVLPADISGGLVWVTWFTGIVPFHCMLIDLQRRGLKQPTLLVYGAPNARELVYDSWLRETARRCAWFHYVPVLPRSEDVSAAAVAEMLAALPPAVGKVFPNGASQRFHPMIAGIRAVVLPARQWFMDTLGFERTAVQKETYD